mgnify:CR=1 FL=1
MSPILKKYEKDASDDKYAFYFDKLVQQIIFGDFPDINDGKITLCLSMENRDDMLEFIRKYIYQCLIKSLEKECERLASDRVFDYLTSNKEYQVGYEVEHNEILDEHILYDIMKETWVGKLAYTMSRLNEQLEVKQEKWRWTCLSYYFSDRIV